MTEHLE